MNSSGILESLYDFIWGRVYGFVGKHIYVKAGKSSAKTRDDAVGNQFGRLEGASFGTDIDRLVCVMYSDGDLIAFLILLVRF